MKFQFLGFSCLVIVFSLFCTNEAVVKLPNNETVSAVIVFGDSIVDPGNNNNLITLIKCDFPPYGRDFMGGKPTGRFNEGKIPTDLMGIYSLVTTTPFLLFFYFSYFFHILSFCFYIFLLWFTLYFLFPVILF